MSHSDRLWCFLLVITCELCCKTSDCKQLNGGLVVVQTMTLGEMIGQALGMFAVLYVLLGALAWQGWFSLMPIISLLTNTYFMSKGDPQLVRKSIFVSSPIMIVYDVLVASYGGILFESVIIISSLIGVLRYRRED